MSELIESKDRRRTSSENNPSPVVLEMELPPPSDGEKDTEKDMERIVKKINRLQTKFSIILFTSFITPFWLIAFWRYGHNLGHWIWLFTLIIYCPIILYIFARICSTFCVTKPLSPAELAYLQENED